MISSHPYVIALALGALSATAGLAAEPVAPAGTSATAHGANKAGRAIHPGPGRDTTAGITPRASGPGARGMHSAIHGRDTALPAVGPQLGGEGTGGIAAGANAQNGQNGQNGRIGSKNGMGTFRSPVLGASGARNTSQINGTGMAAKGVGPATIGPRPKSTVGVNGTGLSTK